MDDIKNRVAMFKTCLVQNMFKTLNDFVFKTFSPDWQIFLCALTN